MRLRWWLWGAGIAAFAALPAYAQTCVTPVQPAFRNLDFSEGNPGERPPGWGPADPACYLPPHDPNPVEIVSSRLCYTGPRCAVVRSVPPTLTGDE